MDDFLREKLENITPFPPEYIWTEIEKELDRKPFLVIFINNWKTISAITFIFLLLAFGAWYFLPNEIILVEEENVFQPNIQELNTSEQIEIKNQTPGLKHDKEALNETRIQAIENQKISSENYVPGNVISEKIKVEEISLSSNEESNQIKVTSSTTTYPENPSSKYILMPDLYFMQTASMNIDVPIDLRIKQVETAEILPINKAKNSQLGSWKMGFYFSPELLLKDFDSVRMLTAYSFNFEPTYYFNNHWFLRFGLGISSMRDRGFANLDYMSNDLMGTYDDVYDITFDTVNGKLVPTYYTETTEVWDSIRHLTVTEATNQYHYLQAPILLGYTIKSSHFNWSFYSGPAINLMVYEKTEMSVENTENITIIDLENRLPERSPYFFQLWIGAGVEYKAGKHLSLALEPNYRYYFSGVYDSSPYNIGFSGFAFRIGIIYKIF
jgi:hypothetical protein